MFWGGGEDLGKGILFRMVGRNWWGNIKVDSKHARFLLSKAGSETVLLPWGKARKV